jgi:hypothetical protein
MMKGLGKSICIDHDKGNKTTYPGNDEGDGAEHDGGDVAGLVEDGSSCNQGDDAGKDEELGWPVDKVCTAEVMWFAVPRH